MKILHLLSQTHLTGAEVYAADLCKYQMSEGHECFIISDTLSVKSDAKYTPMSIHDRKYINRIRNILALLKFCKAQQIDLIHAHSRAGSWLVNVVRFQPFMGAKVCIFQVSARMFMAGILLRCVNILRITLAMS